MRHWDRGKKTARNFLLAVLLAFLIYASQGFPPYTVQGMCRQIQHDYLLGELEPLYVKREWIHFSRQNLHFTMTAARSGDTYTIFRYQDSFLGSHRDWSQLPPVFGEGAVCVANADIIYTAGPFEEAASAAATVYLEKIEDGEVQRTRDITLEGERLAAEVFAFSYSEEEETQRLTFWEEIQRMEESPEGFPEDYLVFREHQEHPSLDRIEDFLGLESLAEYWYRIPSGKGGYIMPSVDLPCIVTLYDEAGQVLETFELSVTTMGLWSWW